MQTGLSSIRLRSLYRSGDGSSYPPALVSLVERIQVVGRWLGFCCFASGLANHENLCQLPW